MTNAAEKLIDTVTGVTRATIAEWAGVSPHTVDSWRKGVRRPSPAAMRRLARNAQRHATRVEQMAAQLHQYLDRRKDK